MNSSLARILLTRGVICKGTVIEIYHNVRGLSCACNATILIRLCVSRASLIGGCRVTFEAVNLEQIAQQVEAVQVVSVDGMTIERLAMAQNLTLEGAELSTRCRRGRRKKVIPIEQNYL